MAEIRPRLVAIAGPSCAGKTTLARALVAALPDAALFSLDAYYADRSHLPPAARARCNFDAPDAIDLPLLVAHLRALAAGRAVEAPIYDFASHSRRPETRRIEPATHVIAEGLFALYFAQLLPLYSYCIYVEADEALCLQRRLARDVTERGRSPGDVRRQCAEQVLPMAERYIYPTRQRAHRIAAGDARVEALLHSVLADLEAGACQSAPYPIY